MAELASTIGVVPITVLATAVAQVRGVRVTMDSTGACAVSAISERGDFVVDQAIAASDRGIGYSLNGGGVVAALASEATAIGDPAYSAAVGKWSKSTGGGAILMGKWVQAASGDGVLGCVLLETVA
jgi:hypothetical protein